MSNLDWENNDFGVTVDSSQELVTPPQVILYLAIALLVISSILFFVSSAIGYVFAVIASIIGGFVVFIDLKRRSDPNYMSLGWFTPVATTTRYLILIVTVLHILRLAIASAR